MRQPAVGKDEPLGEIGAGRNQAQSTGGGTKLSDLLLGQPRLYPLPNLTKQEPFLRAVAAVKSAFGEPGEPEDPAVLLVRVAHAERSSNWAGVSTTDVQMAARLAFKRQWLQEEALDGLRAFLVRELSVTDSPRLLAAGLDAYLDGFATDDGNTRALANTLAEAIPKMATRLPSRTAGLVKRHPALFDVSQGPSAVANSIRSTKDAYSQLKHDGFQDIQGSGFCAAVHASYVEQVVNTSGTYAEMASRLCNWMTPANEPTRERLAELGLNQLILPFVTPNRTANDWPIPTEQDRENLLAWLLKHYGDPRLVQSGVWTTVDKRCVEQVMRWLAGATLEAFIEIIDEAEKGKDNPMWSRRRQFWLDLYEEGHVLDAWVALSTVARQIAQKIATPENRQLFEGLGLQTDRGNTSLLILRTKHHTIIEGSYSYKVHLFSNGNPRTPELYKSVYRCDSLRRYSDASKSHDRPGNWMGWVRSQIL